MCGTSAWEWDPDQGGHRYAYEAVTEICQGCLRKEAMRDEDSAKADGARITLVPRSRAKKMREAPKRRPGR